jgi:2-aminoadipate transaminase
MPDPAAVGEDGRVAETMSHTRHWRAGVVQDVAPPGVHDLRLGYLEPALLPVALLRDAHARALAEYGAAALSYGDNRGALPLREALADRAARADRAGGAHGDPCTPAHVLLTAGTSQALYLLATSLAAPGDAVLVERTSYDFGRKILTDCGLVVRAVDEDGAGMRPDDLDRVLESRRAERHRVAFVCLNPTFHNPTGRVVPLARRRELLAVASGHGVPVVEDDAYAELAFDGTDPPLSLAALAGYRAVVRLCTVSKTLGPGLRLGWMLADPAIADRLVGHGMFVSGGALNHTASLALAVLLRGGGYDRHVAELRSGLRARRDALAGGLREHLDGRMPIDTPGGGFFLWLRDGGGRTEPDLAGAAAQAGVRIAAGSRFGSIPQASARLAFSFNPPQRLAGAARRLAAAWNAVPAAASRP